MRRPFDRTLGRVTDALAQARAGSLVLASVGLPAAAGRAKQLSSARAQPYGAQAARRQDRAGPAYRTVAHYTTAETASAHIVPKAPATALEPLKSSEQPDPFRA